MAIDLSVLYGGGGSSGGLSLPAVPQYQALTQTFDQRRASFENQPRVQREIEYFKDAVQDIESVDDLLNDRRALQFVLSSYALDDEIQYPGRLRKVLEEDPADKKALSNLLIDPRYKEIATGLKLFDGNANTLKSESFLADLEQRYITNEFEKDLGEQNPALRQALFFQRKIGDVEDTYEILGDKNLRAVVIGALGLPEQIALQSVESQKALIEKSIKPGDLKDSDDIQRFVMRFLVNADTAASQSSGFGGGSVGGISFNLLL